MRQQGQLAVPISIQPTVKKNATGGHTEVYIYVLFWYLNTNISWAAQKTPYGMHGEEGVASLLR